MSYLMMHRLGKIKLNGGVVVSEKGTQFTVEDKVTRDILVENKNAIDISNGIPADKATDGDILLIQLQAEKAKNDKLSKQIAELRQQLKDAGLDSGLNEEAEKEEPKGKKGGK